MASRDQADIRPPSDPPYPTCEICGWWDRKLRNTALHVTPEERVIIHKWARHGHLLPASWSKVQDA